jgi:hypothetical protein
MAQIAQMAQMAQIQAEPPNGPNCPNCPNGPNSGGATKWPELPKLPKWPKWPKLPKFRRSHQIAQIQAEPPNCPPLFEFGVTRRIMPFSAKGHTHRQSLAALAPRVKLGESLENLGLPSRGMGCYLWVRDIFFFNTFKLCR